VRFRDVGHLLNIGLLVWFWLTPIVYAGFLVQEGLEKHELLGVNLWNLFLLNPLSAIVFGFQRALYAVVHPVGSPDPVLPTVSLGWLAGVLGTVLVGSLVFMRYTWGRFFDLSGDFAEEL
jgi:ABC-2 type transport system permease protein